MLIVKGNKELTKAIKNLKIAMNNTDKAINNENITFEALEKFEEIEEKEENKFFELIFKIMPSKLAEEMKKSGAFKAQIIDKYILNK